MLGGSNEIISQLHHGKCKILCFWSWAHTRGKIRISLLTVFFLFGSCEVPNFPQVLKNHSNHFLLASCLTVYFGNVFLIMTLLRDNILICQTKLCYIHKMWTLSETVMLSCCSLLRGGSRPRFEKPPRLHLTVLELCLNLTSLLLCITSLALLIGPLAGFNLHFRLRSPRFAFNLLPDSSVAPPPPHFPRPSPSFMRAPPAAAQTWREGRGVGRSQLTARVHC